MGCGGVVRAEVLLGAWLPLDEHRCGCADMLRSPTVAVCATCLAVSIEVEAGPGANQDTE